MFTLKFKRSRCLASYIANIKAVRFTQVGCMLHVNRCVDKLLSYRIFKFDKMKLFLHEICSALSEDSDEEFERQQLDLEVRELRSQVAKAAVSLKDFTKLQQDLERSEQQRAQLSDHIQVCLYVFSCSIS